MYGGRQAMGRGRWVTGLDLEIRTLGFGPWNLELGIWDFEYWRLIGLTSSIVPAPRPATPG
jgi:hypothetical protein